VKGNGRHMIHIIKKLTKGGGMKTVEQIVSKSIKQKRQEMWDRACKFSKYCNLDNINTQVLVYQFAAQFTQNPSTDNWALLNGIMTALQNVVKNNWSITDALKEERELL